MTTQQLADLGPAFTAFLRPFRAGLLQQRTADHFRDSCRGLLSDLPRKSVDPIALAAGTAARTLQEFLTTTTWDHAHARDLLQRRLATVVADLPGDRLGTVGVSDETSRVKKGDRTPGVQRPYLGCVGKIDNGLVTVHVGVAKGRFPARLDAGLFVPPSWADDPKRCRAAGFPAGVRHRARWRTALRQRLRLRGNGFSFDGLTFDEGYGSTPAFLWALGLMGQRFVADVPTNFAVRTRPAGSSVRVDRLQPGGNTKAGKRFRRARKTRGAQVWRARSRRAWVARGWHARVTAVSDATGEVKYFVTNATDAPVSVVLRAAFRRATIEHRFRVATQEAGLMHYEGRSSRGLMRHLTLALIVLGFVSEATDRLRGEKPGGDAGASLPGVERLLSGGGTPGPTGLGAHERGDSVPSATQRQGDEVAQEATA